MKLLTTKEALARIKKHKGNIVINASIGDFGLWVKIAKQEILFQLNHQYGSVDCPWLEVINNEGDLEVTYTAY
jgi:hypothetical protein